jgi:hypothetical protein
VLVSLEVCDDEGEGEVEPLLDVLEELEEDDFDEDDEEDESEELDGLDDTSGCLVFSTVLPAAAVCEAGAVALLVKLKTIIVISATTMQT